MATDCVREMRIDQAPLQSVFSDLNAPTEEERAAFAGWSNRYASPSSPRQFATWRVVLEDDGRKCLEFTNKDVACLMAGEDDWRDYTIEAQVRQMVRGTVPTFDDDYKTESQTGLLFRRMDVRRHYLFCLEGLSRIVLYRRQDDKYHVLAERQGPVDRTRYYHMKVTCQGTTIRCELDGEVFCEVEDAVLPAGPAGIVTGGRARFRGVRLVHPQAAIEALGQLRDRRERELADLRQRYPKPVLWKTVPLPVPHAQVHFRHLRSPHQLDAVLLVRDPRNRHVWWQKLMAIDLEGNVLWEKVPDDNNPHRVKLHGHGGMSITDIDGDGRDEVLTAYDGMVRVLRGSDGEVLKEGPIPLTGAYLGRRGQQMRQIAIYPAQWNKAPAPKGFLMTEEHASGGGNCVVALDSELREMWRYYTISVCFGHSLDIWDIDGDGRDEVAVGFELINADGKRVWQVPDVEYEDFQCGGLHVDAVSVADFDGDGEPEITMCCGGAGFFLVKGRTGQIIARHNIGHAQVAWGGKFVPQLPGMQILCSTLHGNPGIVCLFDGHGRPLHRFQPNHVHERNCPVNWSGDGQELILVTGTCESFGLWDAQGRKVVDRWISEKEFGSLVGAYQADVRPIAEERDQIVLQTKGELRIYRQDRPASGPRIYAPRRRTDVWPLMSYPGWKQ